MSIDVKEVTSDDQIEKLANDLVFRRFVMNRDRLNALFQDIDAGQYLTLSIIYSQRNNECGGKTYLRDICSGLEFPMRRCSNMMRDLKNRGLIIWTHDGDGSEGTYALLTETGEKVYLKQRKVLWDYVKALIEKFGQNNLEEFLGLARQLESIMGTSDDDMADSATEREIQP